MCGLFGFVSEGGAIDVPYFNTLADLASRRGPHAWGVSWQLGRGAPIQTFREAVPYAARTSEPDLSRATAAIGHCRMATSGAYYVKENAQPIPTGEGAVAHNGVLPHVGQIAHRLGVAAVSVDSEIIGSLISREVGSIEQRMLEAVKVIHSDAATALLVLWPDGIAAVRWGHPLYATRHAGGLYFCSRPSRKSSRMLPANQVIAISPSDIK